jgi:hypothetical protein
MTYLNEMVARSIAEERQRDVLLTLRRQQLAVRRPEPVAIDVAPVHHGHWHIALVRLHVLHTPAP